MSPNTLLDRSYAFARDEYIAASSVTDMAVEEYDDCACRAPLWGEDELRLAAELERRVRVSEAMRRRAHDRLVWEFGNVVQAALRKSSDHE